MTSPISSDVGEIQPCPFCGAKPEFYAEKAGLVWHPEAECPLALKWHQRKWWNTRADADRSPIGRDAKLNELIFLAMVAALNELGKGYEQAVLKKHADHAADLWAQHLSVTRAALKDQS